MSYVMAFCLLAVMTSRPDINAKFTLIKDDIYSNSPMVVNFEIIFLWLALCKVKKGDGLSLIWIWYWWHHIFNINVPMYLFALI